MPTNPVSVCNRESQQERVRDQIRQTVQQKQEELIRQQIEQAIGQSANVQNIQQQIQNLQQQQAQAQGQEQTSIQQQIEAAQQSLANEITKVIIPQAVRNVAQAAPVSNSVAAGSSPISSAVSSVATRTTIPQSVTVTNLGQRYGSQAVQAVRQGCSI